MKIVSRSRADRSRMALPAGVAQVWDLPVRLFHWLMVLCFAGTWLSADSERWRLIHVDLGYAMVALVAFRIVWGFIGTPYARFANFVRGPAALLHYLRSLLAGRPEHHTGHNPAGAVAILLLIALTLLTAASGWADFNDVGAAWLASAHETLAEGMLLVVALHLVGVVVSSRLHRENLVLAMLTGRKPMRDSAVPADRRDGAY
jgi:cytochrome b